MCLERNAVEDVEEKRREGRESCQLTVTKWNTLRAAMLTMAAHVSTVHSALAPKILQACP